MSLHEKQALANQLRGELSALRLERESVLQDTHDSVMEAQLDAENERLRMEIAAERTELTDAAGGDGSVADAIAAMYSAAEEETTPPVEATPPAEVPVTPQKTPTKEEQPVAASAPTATKAAVLDLPVQTSGEEK